MSKVRARFWVESTLSLLSLLALVAVTAQRNWVEVLFHVDPDMGSGTLEWAIVGVLLVVLVATSMLARAEWRRAARPALA